ncbi:MAG: amidohydrolase [Candidatus Korarchaeum sp.]|nr:amidohydrolase [Candidatus Korarchaeum sp.]
MDERKPRASVIAVKGGRIVHVGDDAYDMIGGETLVIEAEGRSVLPGFLDTHVHLVGTAESKFDDIDAFGMSSIGEILESLKRLRKPEGEWVRVRGFDDSMVREQRYPTRWELDSVLPDNPVIVKRLDGHSCVLNTLALRIAGIGPEVRGVELDESGRMTGVLRAEANEVARKRAEYEAKREELMRKLLEVSYDALRRGVTTLHALEGSTGDPEHLRLLMNAELPVDIVPYYQTEDVREVLELGLPRIGGCLLVDGSMDSHTAAFFEPYSDKADSRGILYFKDDEIKDFVVEAHKKGLQIAMHAIGDAAIEQLLDAYEFALNEHPRDNHRHRIEHAEVPSNAQINRMAELNVLVAVQPPFLFHWDMSLFYIKRLGKDRANRLHPYRRMLDAGVKLSGGSDSPVTPIDPFTGIYAAVNHPVSGSSIDLEEALRIYTINAAFFSFEEHKKGSISEGKVADLIILSDDIFRVKKEEIRELRVDLVIKRGEVITV